jgi:hypothetical protein
MEIDMRKFLCLLCVSLAMFAFSGCSSSATPAEIKTEYLAMLQEPANSESIAEIGKFLNQNLSKFDEEHADQMVMAYEDYIYALNGEPLDYRTLLDKYEKYISQPLRGLYEIKIDENEKSMCSVTELGLLWTHLCERALTLELFIKENKNYQMIKEEAADIYAGYIRAMFMGTAGTSIFDQSSGNFDQNVKDAYVRFSEIYPDTTVSEMIGEYLYYLESIDFNLDYENITEMTSFIDRCLYFVSEARKRVLQ